MTRLGFALGFALFVAATGCSSGPDPNAQALHDLEVATRALDRAVGVQTAFIGGGNIDSGATPAIIASAILNRVEAEAAGCVAAAAADNTVHADFADGCPLATASMHAGGTVDVTVTSSSAGIDLTLALAITVDNEPLAGNFIVSTSSGSPGVFTYAAPDGLTLEGSTVTAASLGVGIAGGGATLDASHATVSGGALLLNAVHQRFAACYPDEGQAQADGLAATFASDTPQTGVVTLSTGGSDTLPKRAGCPK